MQKKTVELAPLPSDWGDIRVTAIITTENTKNTLEWKARFPTEMPAEKRQAIETMLTTYMQNQHTELIRLFGD